MKGISIGKVLVTLVAVALMAVPAGAAQTPVKISLDSVTVTDDAGLTKVTLNVENNSTIRVGIDANVTAFLCEEEASCDLNQSFDSCEKVASVSSEDSLPAGQASEFNVLLDLGSGQYMLVARAVGSKGGSEDRKEAFVTYILP